MNYPWGSLLRAVALPDTALLTKLAAVAKPDATLDIRVNVQPLRDTAYCEKIGLAHAALMGDPSRLRAVYAAAGSRCKAWTT